MSRLGCAGVVAGAVWLELGVWPGLELGGGVAGKVGLWRGKGNLGGLVLASVGCHEVETGAKGGDEIGGRLRPHGGRRRAGQRGARTRGAGTNRCERCDRSDRDAMREREGGGVGGAERHSLPYHHTRTRDEEMRR